MPPVARVGSIAVTGTGTDTFTTPSYDNLGGGPEVAFVIAVFRSGGILDSPVISITRGADSAFFLAARATGLSNATAEMWLMLPSVETTGAFVVAFESGFLVDAIVCAIELQNCGYQSPEPNTADASGATGTSSSASLTVEDSLGGDHTTIVVPASVGLVFAVCGVVSILSSVAATSGTTELAISVGSGATRLSAAVSWLRATGGADAMTFGFGSAEYAEEVIGVFGAALNGIIKPGGMLPRVK